MALLYSNENYPQPVVEELRRWGHDVLTVLEAGKADQAIEDDLVLAFAVSRGRAMLTLNRKHFIRLHQLHPGHAGIVICTFDPDFIGQAARIHTALESLANLSGELLRVNRPQSGRLGMIELIESSLSGDAKSLKRSIPVFSRLRCLAFERSGASGRCGSMRSLGPRADGPVPHCYGNPFIFRSTHSVISNPQNTRKISQWFHSGISFRWESFSFTCWNFSVTDLAWLMR